MQNDLKKLFEKIKETNVLKYNLLNKTKIFFFIRKKRIFPSTIIRIFISLDNRHTSSASVNQIPL